MCHCQEQGPEELTTAQRSRGESLCPIEPEAFCLVLLKVDGSARKALDDPGSGTGLGVAEETASRHTLVRALRATEDKGSDADLSQTETQGLKPQKTARQNHQAPWKLH